MYETNESNDWPDLVRDLFKSEKHKNKSEILKCLSENNFDIKIEEEK